MIITPASINGVIRKLKSVLADPIQYSLPIGEYEIPLNPYLGKIISIKFLKISCIYCGTTIKKSYNQGYCFPCMQKLARCDVCIIKPEKCHYHLGTCREPEWGVNHCFIPHIIYLANTSGFKIGITRETQIPTRWIDQGAIQALPLFRVQSRYHSGLLEVALKAFVQDKTNWRKMLSSEGEALDLLEKRDQLLTGLKESGHLKEQPLRVPPLQDFTDVEANTNKINPERLDEATITHIRYPVLTYPGKVKALNVESATEIKGTLLGIKGQYLILDVGVINIRNLSGYVLECTFF